MARVGDQEIPGPEQGAPWEQQQRHLEVCVPRGSCGCGGGVGPQRIVLIDPTVIFPPKWNPVGCPGCGLMPEKVWGQWEPHAPGDLAKCRGA